ncbi:hypothetical protein GCM10010177_49360 [Actinomadura citrea]|nr:hypothetical protein GCM10010177_49360 [Actinomadura citrea]
MTAKPEPVNAVPYQRAFPGIQVTCYLHPARSRARAPAHRPVGHAARQIPAHPGSWFLNGHAASTQPDFDRAE